MTTAKPAADAATTPGTPKPRARPRAAATGTRRSHAAKAATTPVATPAAPAAPITNPTPDDAAAFGTEPQSGSQSEARDRAQHRAQSEAQSELSGAAILDECESFVRRFWVAPSDAAYKAFVLWAAHTHGIAAFSRSGRLALLGDEPGIGKTRGLDLLVLLCSNASIELDPTGPAFAAKIATESPTILLDETDTIWGKNGGSSGAMKTLRAILNSGYKRGAKISRKQGKEIVTTSVFGPVAFAGMGNLPDTLMSRSVVIRMRKRKPSEKIDTYMPRMHEPMGKALGDALHDWVTTQLLVLQGAWPDMPDGIADRNSEVAEPLLAIADAAGGTWPEDARAALRQLLLDAKDETGPSPAEQILRDIRTVWPPDVPGSFPRIATADLLYRLFFLEGARWAEMWEPIAASRELATLLSSHPRFRILPVKVKIDGKAVQGYKREHFVLPWQLLDRLDAERAAEKAAAEAERLARKTADSEGSGGSVSSGDDDDDWSESALPDNGS